MSKKVLFFAVVGGGGLNVPLVLNQIIARKVERDDQESGLADQVTVEVAMFESEGDARSGLANGFAGHTQIAVYESKRADRSFTWRRNGRPKEEVPDWATRNTWIVAIGNLLPEARVKTCANQLLSDVIAWVSNPDKRNYPWGQAKKPKEEKAPKPRRRRRNQGAPRCL
ncbi:MAG: hypothetical protein K8Q91_02055 [Candidatus Vogelbacteria bacterium]|nr:hypothetical protein [Candidatus Vogelbacteria bacterium]